VDVPYRTTSKKSIKSWNRPLTWAKAATEALAQALFAATDASARQRGWQVTSTRCGFGRRYRDPRFDTLTPCPAYDGRRVHADGIECPRCHDPGRIAVKPDAQSSSDLQPGRLT
jgi:hypothetical protein